MNNKSTQLLRTILVAAITLGVYKLIHSILTKYIPNQNLESLIAQCVFTILVLCAVAVLKKWDIFQVKQAKLMKYWYVAWLLFVQMFLVFSQRLDNFEITIPGNEILFFILQMILVGVCEEVLFRGLIQNACHKFFGEDSWFHVILAVLVTGLLFGAAHLTNGFHSEIGFKAASIQAIATVASGIYFCSIYYRTGKNIWYLIFLHALYDIFVSIGNGRLSGKTTSDVISAAGKIQIQSVLVLFVIYGGISLFIMRPKKVQPFLIPKEN